MKYQDLIAQSKKDAAEFDRLARLEVKMDKTPGVLPELRQRLRQRVLEAAAALTAQIPKDGQAFEAYIGKAKLLLTTESLPEEG